jgi:hypothetical protein
MQNTAAQLCQTHAHVYIFKGAHGYQTLFFYYIHVCSCIVKKIQNSKVITRLIQDIK